MGGRETVSGDWSCHHSSVEEGNPIWGPSRSLRALELMHEASIPSAKDGKLELLCPFYERENRGMRFVCEVHSFSTNSVHAHILYIIYNAVYIYFPYFSFPSPFLIPSSSGRSKGQADRLSAHGIALPAHGSSVSGREPCWLLDCFHFQLTPLLLSLQRPSKTWPPHPRNACVSGESHPSSESDSNLLACVGPLTLS